MSGTEAFRYDGTRVLVVGGATGMGAAAAQTVTALGGEVVVMDHATVEYPVEEAVKVDTGHVMSSLTGSYEPGQALARMLLGRS